MVLAEWVRAGTLDIAGFDRRRMSSGTC